MLTLLLIGISLFTLGKKPVEARFRPKNATMSTATVRVFPEVIELGPGPVIGQTFTVAVVAEDVVGKAYGLEVQFSWNTTYLEYVNHKKTIPVENHPNPIPPSPYPGVLHSPTIPVKDDVDETASMPGSLPGTMYWLAEASMFPAPIFQGNGTAFIMTFRVKNQSYTADLEIPLHITDAHIAETECVGIFPEIVDGLVIIRTPSPDVNRDSVVDILDIVEAADAYGSRVGDPNWNPWADLTQTYGVIDILDLVTCASHYGETYP